MGAGVHPIRLWVRVGERDKQVDLLQQICATTPLAMALFCRDLLVREFSPAAELLFGRTAEDSQPTSMTRLIEARSANDLRLEVGSLLGHGKGGRQGTTLELTAQRPDGSFLQVEAALCPVHDGEGDWILASFKDISEIRRLTAQASLAQRLDSVGQLAAGIAHELNTPIQYVGDNTHFLSEAFTELLATADELLERLPGDPGPQPQMDYLRKEVPEAVEQSLDGIRRLRSIVGAMREFSHPGSDDTADVDLARTIHSAVAVARNEWKFVADVRLDIDPNLPPARGNQAEISQVLLNLVLNAAQAIQETGENGRTKGTIEIRARRRGRMVETRVVDSGAGIPEWAKSRVFDPFFTTKPAGQGTGQGLAISHSVVARLGGTIEFESEPGQGTTFTVRLPIQILDKGLTRTAQ